METVVIEAGGNDNEELDIAAILAFTLGLELAELASPGNRPRVHQLARRGGCRRAPCAAPGSFYCAD